MPNGPDNRRRTDLDLFVLALVEGGVSTPYELQRAAGISQGASIPALQRLREASFVRRGKTGSRGRSEYKVTAAGRKFLSNGWRPLIEAGPSGDLDADLRVALLALAAGDRRLASYFLNQAADKKLQSLTAVAKTEGPTEVAPLALWYKSLRTSAGKRLIEAESAAVRDMAELLPRKLSKLRGRPNTKSNR